MVIVIAEPHAHGENWESVVLRYVDPIDDALKRKGLGAISAYGTYDEGAVGRVGKGEYYPSMDVKVDDVAKSIATVMGALDELIPTGSSVYIYLCCPAPDEHAAKKLSGAIPENLTVYTNYTPKTGEIPPELYYFDRADERWVQVDAGGTVPPP